MGTMFVRSKSPAEVEWKFHGVYSGDKTYAKNSRDANTQLVLVTFAC